MRKNKTPSAIVEMRSGNCKLQNKGKMCIRDRNPMSSLNPTMNIERQIAEGILLHNFDKKSKTQVHDRVDELLTPVSYTHLSEFVFWCRPVPASCSASISGRAPT